MSEDDNRDRNEFISLNLTSLVECTILTVELINRLAEKRLITTSEQEYFRNGIFGNSEKVTKLYSETARKWDDEQFKKFIDILKLVGSLGACEIFTAEGAEVYLTRDEVYCLKEQMNKVMNSKGGAYEGITFEDEMAANTIVKNFAECSISSWGEFASEKGLEERRAIVPRIKKFLRGITRGDIWYNNSKQSLPRNYIERRLKKTKDYDSVKNTFLELLHTTDKLLLNVDPPGMGKSSALTKLEMDFRKIEGFPHRIIIRINLNQFCGTLQKMSNRQLTLESFIEQFARYIPLEKLKNKTEFERVPVYVLLDGLDEVLPEYKETMLNLLRGLLISSGNDSDKLFVRKVVLTTRPHLKELIEQEFKVQSHSLCPLDKNEQVHYLHRSLKSTNPSIEIARTLIHNLRSEVRVLLSNPLMLHLYSEICSDEMSAEVIDLYSLYSMFIDRKHESYLVDKEMADPAQPSTMRRMKNFLTNNLPFYIFVAITDLKKENINQITALHDGLKLIAKPEQNELDEIVSYGLIVMEGHELKFKHRSFAEYFWAKLIVETNNEKLRNSLFGFGYEKGNLIATFLNCKLPNEAICGLVHDGWTTFIPFDASLARYDDEDGFLIDHILANTINYADECSGKNRILVRDLYDEKLFFRWLEKKVKNDKKKWLEQILFHDNMSEVVAALVFSGDSAIDKFVQTWWPSGFDEEELRHLVRKCPSPILIAIKAKYTENSFYKLCTESLYERTSQWLSCQDLKKFAREILENSPLTINTRTLYDVFYNPDVISFIACSLSKDEIIHFISNDKTRILDVVGSLRLDHIRWCFGEEFLPKKLLRFRNQFGSLKGNSLFVSSYVPRDLMDRVWKEIEENVDDAVQVIFDDEDFHLVNILEEDIRFLKMCITGCPSQNTPSECQRGNHLISHRIELVKNLLDRVDFIKFWEKNCPRQWWNVCYLIAYGRLEPAMWKEVLAEKEVEDYICDSSNLSTERLDLNKVFGGLLLSAINIDNCPENKKLTRAPFELVLAWLRLTLTKESLFEEYFFIDILTRLSISELGQLARNQTENPCLLIELPNVWEIMFLPNGLVSKTKLKLKDNDFSDQQLQLAATIAGQEAVGNIKRAVFTYSLSCCSVGLVLGGIRDAFNKLYGEDIFKTYFKSKSTLESLFGDIERNLGGNAASVAQCFVSAMVGFCLDVFDGRLLEWIERAAVSNPVALLVAGKKTDISDLIKSHVEQIVLKKVNAEDNRSFLVSFIDSFKCYRSCDYYRLLKIFPQFKHKIPHNYQEKTEVHSNWRNCALRVWIEMFGEEETRRQTELNDLFNIWGRLIGIMNNGELLHIAVQIGSLRGVKENAWPGSLSWKDEKNGQTALEKAQEKWGPDHEITRFLRRRSDNLFHSGCRDHRNSPKQ